MSVNYTQRCIFGFKINRKDIERIISPAQYEEQPRYDTKTGKETHREKVLVKQQERIYQIANIECDDFYNLEGHVRKDFAVDCFTDQDVDNIYVGFCVPKSGSRSYGNDLLDGSVSMSDVVDLGTRLVNKKIINQTPELHFVSFIG